MPHKIIQGSEIHPNSVVEYVCFDLSQAQKPEGELVVNTPSMVVQKDKKKNAFDVDHSS